MTYWKSPDFKALQESWYRRLEAEGFQDAEKVVRDELVLKQSANNSYRGQAELTRDIKECYYRILAQQLQEAEFRNEADQLVMTWHADGRKIKDIVVELERRGQRRCRYTVRIIIRRYEMKWGVREHSRQKLHLKA